MNTINRPRKRPRKRSSNFRSLWALVFREACYQVLVGRFGFDADRPSRARVWRWRRDKLSKMLARILRAYPERRYLP